MDSGTWLVGGDLGEHLPGAIAVALGQHRHADHFARSSEEGLAGLCQRRKAGDHFVGLQLVIFGHRAADRRQVAIWLRQAVVGRDLPIDVDRGLAVILTQRDRGRGQQCGAARVTSLDAIDERGAEPASAPFTSPAPILSIAADIASLFGDRLLLLAMLPIEVAADRDEQTG